MKPSLPPHGLYAFSTGCWRCAFPRASPSRPPTRHASSQSSPRKHRRWIRLAAVTVAAAGIGAYIRSEQAGSSILNPFSFTKYYLVSKEPVSSTGSILTLKPAKPAGNAAVYEEAWRTGVWSVMFKQPQLQIGRDYTPLPPASDEEDSLRFFVRRDPYGEVSRYLHGLSLGSAVEMRGPQLEYKIPSSTKDVLFIAGGTGIAPALQASHTVLRRTDGNKPRIHILWANRRREDCLGGVNDIVADTPKPWFWGIFTRKTSAPVQAQKDPPSPVVRELESLQSQYPGQLTVDYFVDEESTFIRKKNILDFAHSTSGDKGKLILVSGPEGFISYMAGPKVWAQGTEMQGPRQGIIREANLKQWKVWKL